VGEVIHYGADRLDLGERVGSFVQTDDGFVYTSEDGRVHLADGQGTQAVGRTNSQGLNLKSDDAGSLAAWVEFPDGALPSSSSTTLPSGGRSSARTRAPGRA
jgi:hypothetical protein